MVRRKIKVSRRKAQKEKGQREGKKDGDGMGLSAATGARPLELRKLQGKKERAKNGARQK